MNYGAMRSQMLGILNRTDCTDDLAKTFFDQAISRCNRELRLPNMEFILSPDTSAGPVSSITVPSNWLEMIALTVTLSDSCEIELQYVDLGTFIRRKNEGIVDPLFYTRKYDQWLVVGDIPQGSTVEVYYYGELDSLVLDSDEPVLTKIAPDLIIYCALTYAADYFLDDRLVTWEAKYQGLKAELEEQASEGENQDGTNAIAPAYTYDDWVN